MDDYLKNTDQARSSLPLDKKSDELSKEGKGELNEAKSSAEDNKKQSLQNTLKIWQRHKSFNVKVNEEEDLNAGKTLRRTQSILSSIKQRFRKQSIQEDNKTPPNEEDCKSQSSQEENEEINKCVKEEENNPTKKLPIPPWLNEMKVAQGKKAQRNQKYSKENDALESESIITKMSDDVFEVEEQKMPITINSPEEEEDIENGKIQIKDVLYDVPRKCKVDFEKVLLRNDSVNDSNAEIIVHGREKPPVPPKKSKRLSNSSQEKNEDNHLPEDIKLSNANSDEMQNYLKKVAEGINLQFQELNDNMDSSLPPILPNKSKTLTQNDMTRFNENNSTEEVIFSTTATENTKLSDLTNFQKEVQSCAKEVIEDLDYLKPPILPKKSKNLSQSDLVKLEKDDFTCTSNEIVNFNKTNVAVELTSFEEITQNSVKEIVEHQESELQHYKPPTPAKPFKKLSQSEAVKFDENDFMCEIEQIINSTLASVQITNDLLDDANVFEVNQAKDEEEQTKHEKILNCAVKEIDSTATQDLPEQDNQISVKNHNPEPNGNTEKSENFEETPLMLEKNNLDGQTLNELYLLLASQNLNFKTEIENLKAQLVTQSNRISALENELDRINHSN